MSGKEAVVTTDANPRAPGPSAPLQTSREGREGGPKNLAPLSCALTIGALDKSKYKKYLRSEPLRLGVTILLPRS